MLNLKGDCKGCEGSGYEPVPFSIDGEMTVCGDCDGLGKEDKDTFGIKHPDGYYPLFIGIELTGNKLHGMMFHSWGEPPEEV